MVDNVAITAGSGTSIATDDIGTVHYQRVKVSHGADGSATDTSTASPLPVRLDCTIVDVTLSLNTSIYADGDLLADTQVVSNAFRVNDGYGMLHSVTVLDEDDVGQPFDIYFLSSSASMGTENSAVSVTDADARDILGRVVISSGDFYDLGSCKIATRTGVGLLLKAASGTDDLYVAAVSRGTGTYTASGIRLKLGIFWY